MWRRRKRKKGKRSAVSLFLNRFVTEKRKNNQPPVYRLAAIENKKLIMSYEDPYLTMSITSPGPATLPAHEKKVYAPRSTNDISDIDGARPQPKYKVYANKPQFLNGDIPGATSKQLIRGRNVRDNSLYIDDIDGTRRTIKDRMMRTNRHVDPLQPNYPLPTFVPTEPVTVPFKRDPLNISDIEGTKPKPKQEFAPKDTMFISDIEGARPGLRET